MGINPDVRKTIEDFKGLLHVEKNFDIVYRTLKICNRESAIFFVDGFAKDEIIEKILEFFYSVDNEAFMRDAHTFSKNCVPYCELSLEYDADTVVTSVLSGMMALFVDGFDRCILVDTRTYPQRSTSEPEKDKVFRGSKDGFVETLILNTALIRRRIRDRNLHVEHMSVGRASKTDIALCYIDDRVDHKLVDQVREKLKNTDTDALTMNQQSLAEILLRRKWYNPFPKFKYSERPDTTAAQILEGDLVIMVDNSPSAMILPINLFDLMEEANDFYFPPITGSYLRLTRFSVSVATLLLTPLWLLLLQNPDWVPSWLQFILVEESSVPVFWQLMILEIAIDGLKLAALNTPNMLTTSLSMVGAVILGDFAVKSGWFSGESLLYMAFVTIANYSLPSFELGYALKFCRMVMLVATVLLNAWGFFGSIVLLFIALACNKTISGDSYLYPLLPFNYTDFKKKVLRIKREN